MTLDPNLHEILYLLYNEHFNTPGTVAVMLPKRMK